MKTDSGTKIPAITGTEKSSGVRPFAEADIPRIVDLHHRVMSKGHRADSAFFRRHFFDSPWVDPELPSFVHVNDSGEIDGFIGTVPRPLRRPDGEIVRAAFTTKFMMEPGAPSSMASLQLFRAFLSGPQEISFADVTNENSRRFWNSLRGEMSPVHSIGWQRVLHRRPSQRLRVSRSPVAKLGARMFGDAIDGIANFRSAAVPAAVAGYENTAFNTDVFLTLIPKWRSKYAWVPDQTADRLRWSIERLSDAPDLRHHGALVVGPRGVVGAFLYCVNRAGKADVAMFAAHPKHREAAFDMLLHHAYARGVCQIGGRVDPDMSELLSQRLDVRTSMRRYPMCMHAKDPALRTAFLVGDIRIEPIEGEYLTQFHGER